MLTIHKNLHNLAQQGDNVFSHYNLQKCYKQMNKSHLQKAKVKRFKYFPSHTNV